MNERLPHGRHITRAVRAALRKQARDRCCICGKFISAPDIAEDRETPPLENHHIVYFSEGGVNSPENLLVVDPECHARIHASRERYPDLKLLEAKKHWEQMVQLLPATFIYENDDWDRAAGENTVVTFYFAAVNLEYRIQGVPLATSVGRLARFIREYIVRPLVSFFRLAPFQYHLLGLIQLRNMGLVRKKAPWERLDATISVSDLRLEQDDALMALVDVQAVAAREVSRRQETESKARVTLSWGKEPRDLDLHVVSSRYHVYYGARGNFSSPPWMVLDIDIRNGFGPEVVSIEKRASDPIWIIVENYSEEVPLSRSDAKVVVELPNRVVEFACPREGSGRYWRVGRVDCATDQVEPIGGLTNDPNWG
jgi:hypothetical protein